MHPGPYANPWVAMWTHPQSTIRSIVQTNPKYGIVWLSTIYILQNIFYYLNFWSFGFKAGPSALLLPSVALSPFLAFVWVYFYGWILSKVGRLLGGAAPHSHVRCALAWSRIPTFLSLVMWFFLIISNPDYAFVQYGAGATIVFVHLILLISQIWSFVLLIQSLREIQRFSIKRSLANICLAALIYSLFLFVFALIFLSILNSLT